MRLHLGERSQTIAGLEYEIGPAALDDHLFRANGSVDRKRMGGIHRSHANESRVAIDRDLGMPCIGSIIVVIVPELEIAMRACVRASDKTQRIPRRHCSVVDRV